MEETKFMIECIRFKTYQKGSLQGFADLRVGKWGIDIPGFTIYLKEGRRWVNPPGKEYEDREGNKKFKAFFYFKEKSDWELFMKEAKESIDKICQGGQQPQEITPHYDVGKSNTKDQGCPF